MIRFARGAVRADGKAAGSARGIGSGGARRRPVHRGRQGELTAPIEPARNRRVHRIGSTGAGEPSLGWIEMSRGRVIVEWSLRVVFDGGADEGHGGDLRVVETVGPGCLPGRSEAFATSGRTMRSSPA